MFSTLPVQFSNWEAHLSQAKYTPRILSLLFHINPKTCQCSFVYCRATLPLISDWFPGLRMCKTQPKFQVSVAYPAHLSKHIVQFFFFFFFYDTFQEAISLLSNNWILLCFFPNGLQCSYGRRQKLCCLLRLVIGIFCRRRWNPSGLPFFTTSICSYGGVTRALLKVQLCPFSMNPCQLPLFTSSRFFLLSRACFLPQTLVFLVTDNCGGGFLTRLFRWRVVDRRQVPLVLVTAESFVVGRLALGEGFPAVGDLGVGGLGVPGAGDPGVGGRGFHGTGDPGVSSLSHTALWPPHGDTITDWITTLVTLLTALTASDAV